MSPGELPGALGILGGLAGLPGVPRGVARGVSVESQRSLAVPEGFPGGLQGSLGCKGHMGWMGGTGHTGRHLQ